MIQWSEQTLKFFIKTIRKVEHKVSDERLKPIFFVFWFEIMILFVGDRMRRRKTVRVWDESDVRRSWECRGELCRVSYRVSGSICDWKDFVDCWSGGGGGGESGWGEEGPCVWWEGEKVSEKSVCGWGRNGCHDRATCIHGERNYFKQTSIIFVTNSIMATLILSILPDIAITLSVESGKNSLFWETFILAPVDWFSWLITAPPIPIMDPTTEFGHSILKSGSWLVDVDVLCPCSPLPKEAV